MAHIISIRKANTGDASAITEVVRNAYLSNVNKTWCTALTKEITFELIVVFAAIMFILIGVPLTYCLAAVPLVLVLIYISIYSSLFMKAIELSSMSPMQCWVAEAYEPLYHIDLHKENSSYQIVSEETLWNDGTDISKFRRKVVGTISLSKSRTTERTAWLFRFAVDSKYRRKGIGLKLIETARDWAKRDRYDAIHLALSECHEDLKKLFADAGFEMRQLYHQQILGTVIVMLMYQLECKLKSNY